MKFMNGRGSSSSDTALTNEDVGSFLSPYVQLSLFLFSTEIVKKDIESPA